MNQVLDKDPEGPEDLIFVLIIILGLVMLVLILILGKTAHAEVYDSEILADAIYVIEGGQKAKKPFGILSVPCNGYEDCRQVCINTIEANFTRWQASGATGDFLNFLGNRYAPPQAHPLNRNWIPNLKSVLAKLEVKK